MLAASQSTESRRKKQWEETKKAVELRLLRLLRAMVAVVVGVDAPCFQFRHYQLLAAAGGIANIRDPSRPPLVFGVCYLLFLKRSIEALKFCLEV